MIRKSAVVLLGALLLVSFGVVLAPERVSACSCPMPSSPEQQVKDSLARKTAIFAGTVTAVKQPPWRIFMSSADQVEVTFEVSQVWKGNVERKTVVSTASSGSSCGYESFDVGTSYIVSAYGEAGSLETGMCEMTMPLASASAQLAALGDGYEPLQRPAGASSFNTSLSLTITIAALAIVLVFIARSIKQRSR